MELTVLNPSFEKIYILDSYESLVWVDKFAEVGTFEIYTPVTDDILKYLVKDNYLVNPDSEHVMIIEDFSLDSDLETGNHIKIIGRSLESILDRRIIWDTIDFKEKHNFHKAIKKLITRCLISPDGQRADKARRKVDNFIFQDSQDTTITSLKLKDGVQYHGENLLEIIEELCNDKKIGFKITLSENNEFIFTLYNGVDRSYKQEVNPYVVFKPSFDNLISSNYREENSKVKNLACVLGAENNEGDKPEEVVGDTSVTGLNRREIFVDASDIEWDAEEEDDSGDEEGQKTSIEPEDYIKLMQQRGKKEIKETTKGVKAFDGQCETIRLYRYGTDFFMGDVVQLMNEYGMEASSRITEFTWSHSTSGLETYPTFTPVEDEEEEENS